jgi:peroxiredoxin
MKTMLAALPLALALLAAAPLAAAQTPPAIEGRTVDGKPFQLASLKGKVVLLMFWSTGCAVCRDKMPELRQNYQGWAGKPFEMVLVSTDRRRKDLDDYEAIITRTVPLKQRFVQLWAGEAGYKDNLGTPATQLPASFLIDKSGKVVEKYQGRIPAEAWDRIAELL